MSKEHNNSIKGGSNKKKPKIKIFTKKKKTGQSEEAVIRNLVSQYEKVNLSEVTKFADLPLSHKTIKALKESKYLNLTDIQKASIPLALQGKDILGAAQTGSGKTLAFLVPILEALYREQWTRLDGVGALVITPTRELAYQIFETLRKVGKYHDFSAGLIIGGKDLKFERKRMDQCNIIICTPGRLLQHMDENPLFDCVSMKILVLDEADRCLDMGFKATMNAIIGNLPLERQTLLFSATQTKSVQDLARLSLKDPSYVSVNEMTTPKELKQSYVICELKDKLSVIWSFIRNHLKQKTIIFFSTCKEVKYFYEIFCKLRPGLSLLPLYGTLHQLRRMKIYEDFCRKQSAVLFATDLAARGLDFPEVHWVVQADCPEDVETYIHRVGRTARYHKGGESLLLLMPSETKLLDHLEEKKIPIKKTEINPAKQQNPIAKISAFLAKDSSLKDTAQRAVSHYARAVYFMKNKEIFKVQKLDFESFSKSLGLAVSPRIRFLGRLGKQHGNLQTSEQVAESKNVKHIFGEEDVKYGDDGSALDLNSTSEPNDDNDFKFSNINNTVSKGSHNFELSDSDDDAMLQIKRKDHDIEIPSNIDVPDLLNGRGKKAKVQSKAAMVKKMLKKKIVPNKKILFDEEGTAVQQGTRDKKSELAKEYENEDSGGIDIEKAKLVLREEDKFDKQMFKAKVKAKHKEQKRKLKELNRKQQSDEEKDDFGESDSDEGPDLSWLPDPDKIYGKKLDEDREMDRNHSGDVSVTMVKVGEKNGRNTKDKRKKRKSDGEQIIDGPVKKKKKLHLARPIGDELDVNETEELALMLLKG